MMRPTIGLHPSFDALSAHADRADTDAARSRVGRHVARCAACRETVTEIRALGEAARTREVSGAPAGLWARIERSIDQTEPIAVDLAEERTVPMAATRDDDTPAPRAEFRGSASKTVRRTALGLVVLVAASAAVLALDSRDQLAAATPRRLQTDRDHARPGAPITFHYRPIPALAEQRSLTVWMVVPGRGEQHYDQALERAGTLRRASALDFTGSVVMPDSAPLAMFIVGDSTGDIIDRTEIGGGRLPSVVLAANSLGQPRLDAFVLALGGRRGSSNRAVMTKWAMQMRAVYPTSPETWIITDPYAHRGVVGDIVKLFESRERRYYGWHDRLEHRTGLSEATETMMANLAWELMDTARAEFWTTRLMRDHPTSGSLPSLWILHYRDVPDDSAAIVLRAFEPIYVRSGPGRTSALERAIMLAHRSGDSSLIRRWDLRVDPRAVSWSLGAELTHLARDSAALRDVKRVLQAALVEADSEEHGGPTLWGRDKVFARYKRQRAQTRLAALRLIDGDATGAKAELDSISHDASPWSGCPLPETIRWRAEASRRLGQMAEARADLAYVVVMGDWRVQVLSDSAPTLLGSAYSKASWDSALVAANALKQECWANSRAARRRLGG